MPTFPCPTCQRPVEWSAAAKWRPFCSERCRLIDLGAWMAEQHAIPGDEISPDGVQPSTDEPDDPPRH
jgi:endogenous inhibitor of DNA gyrase (YacG/DUF329 family)